MVTRFIDYQKGIALVYLISTGRLELTIASNYRDSLLSEVKLEVTDNSGSGILLVDREKIDKVGGFDENLLMGWGSDGELYQRFLRAGYKCFYVPSAFGYHEDKLNVTQRKYRAVGQIHNRLYFILSHYSVKSLILLLPMFVLYEFFQMAFIVIKGMFPQYIKGNLLIIKNLPAILKKRKLIKRIRKVPDFKGALWRRYLRCIIFNSKKCNIQVFIKCIFFYIYNILEWC